MKGAAIVNFCFKNKDFSCGQSRKGTGLAGLRTLLLQFTTGDNRNEFVFILVLLTGEQRHSQTQRGFKNVMLNNKTFIPDSDQPLLYLDSDFRPSVPSLLLQLYYIQIIFKQIITFKMHSSDRVQHVKCKNTASASTKITVAKPLSASFSDQSVFSSVFSCAVLLKHRCP